MFNVKYEKNKAQLRAWLYQALAELETSDNVEAHKKESAMRKTTLEIEFINYAD